MVRMCLGEASRQASGLVKVGQMPKSQQQLQSKQNLRMQVTCVAGLSDPKTLNPKAQTLNPSPKALSP